jgi:Rho-binding antiterminator
MKHPSTPYRPISCNFYDELELAAMRKKPVIIRFMDVAGNERSIQAVIQNLYSVSGEEFMLLDTGEKLRLDQLLSVDGKMLQNYC